jgi:hypothetical protein
LSSSDEAAAGAELKWVARRESASGMRLPTPGLVIFISTLVVFAFSLNSVWSADHPTSLLQLSYSLWANHSVVLGKEGQFTPQTVDDFLYKGYYYSALAPGAPVLALPFVGLGFLLDGKFNLFGDAMLLSEFFVALCNAIAAYLVFKLASLYFTEKTSVFVAFAYAFSTISWPFTTFFFESDVSAMFDVLAVYLAIRMARGRSSSLASAVLCGAALGVALTVDYINAVLVPIVALFLLYTFWKDFAGFAKRFTGLLVTSALGVVSLALYNKAAFGSPFVTTEQAYLHTSSVFGSFSYPILEGLYLDLFSPLRGVFVYSPVLIIGAVGFYYMLGRREVKVEGILLAACFVGILLPYSMWYDVAGGEGFGQRFLIPVIPFLLLPSGFIIEGKRRDLATLGYILYGVGVFFCGIAAVTTTIPQVVAVSHFTFVTQVLPSFLSDNLAVWWGKRVGDLWWAPSILIVAVASLLPLFVTRLSGRRRPAKSS